MYDRTSHKDLERLDLPCNSALKTADSCARPPSLTSLAPAGDNFSYSEAMEVPNVAVAGIGSSVLAFAYIILSLKFLRPLVMRVLPAAGEGPSEKQQVEGFW